MSSESILDLRLPWPWGRTAPLKRLEDLHRRKVEAERKKARLEQIYREQLIAIDRVVESIEADIQTAQKCEGDRLRRMVQALTASLERRGITIPKELASRTPDEALLEELKLLGKGVPELEQAVELDISDEAVLGGQVGFEEVAELARSRR